MAYHVRLFRSWAAGDDPQHWKRVGEITADTLMLWGREDRILPLDTSLLCSVRCATHGCMSSPTAVTG